MVSGKVDGQILFGARSEKPKIVLGARGEKWKNVFDAKWQLRKILFGSQMVNNPYEAIWDCLILHQMVIEQNIFEIK